MFEGKLGASLEVGGAVVAYMFVVQQRCPYIQQLATTHPLGCSPTRIRLMTIHTEGVDGIVMQRIAAFYCSSEASWMTPILEYYA